ncbi:MAG: M20 family metallopeptidase [bacterium]
MPPSLAALIARALPEVVALRHDLHAHPEIAYQEHRTSKLITRELTALGIAHAPGLAGGTGVVAHLPASTDVGNALPAVGLRADIDALPIAEQTGLPYASSTPGRMHACGHDGHTAILLGVARVLKDLPRPRPVTLVFQPAEEGGGGERLCNEGLLDGAIIGPRIEKMFGLHGWPELPVGTVGTRAGPLLASTDELRATIVGVGSHAAYPHHGRDPILAMSQCIVALQTLVSRGVSPTDSVVLSVCIVKGGSASNVIPDSATFTATLRCLEASSRKFAHQRASEIIQATASAGGCAAELNWQEGYPVTYNDPALTARFFTLADAWLGPANVVRVPHPSMGGEDFSYYAQRVPSVFFCLGLKCAGQARTPMLHQPDFDFNDQAIPLGIEVFCRLATEA